MFRGYSRVLRPQDFVVRRSINMQPPAVEKTKDSPGRKGLHRIAYRQAERIRKRQHRLCLVLEQGFAIHINRGAVFSCNLYRLVRREGVKKWFHVFSRGLRRSEER